MTPATPEASLVLCRPLGKGWVWVSGILTHSVNHSATPLSHRFSVRPIEPGHAYRSVSFALEIKNHFFSTFFFIIFISVKEGTYRLFYWQIDKRTAESKSRIEKIFRNVTPKVQRGAWKFK